MRPAEQFLIAILDLLKMKFPEDKKSLEDFEHIMWIDISKLTNEEIQSIDNFIGYMTDKIKR